MKKNLLLILLILFVVFGISAGGQKEEEGDYPSRPITMLMGYAPGGGSDQLAQLIEPFLEPILGVPFSNEYLPGASGAIAWTKLAKNTKPDGYTICVTNTPSIATNVFMESSITYKIDEFEPLANVVTDPGIIVVGKDSPFKTFQDFLKAAKDNPGSLSVGNSGVGGDDFFATLLFEKMVGVDLKDVPFQGDGPSWQAAMGGKIDASFNNVGITFPQVKAGNLRALAVMADKRMEALPDVPTLKELGYDLKVGSSRGVSAPAGLPKAVREKLLDAFKKIAEDPELKQRAANLSLPLDWKFGDEYRDYLESFKQYESIWQEVKDQYAK